MSTVLTTPAESRVVALRPVLSPRLALRWSHVALCAGLAGFFLYLNYMPLYHTDLWGHVQWGQQILSTGLIPAENPFMPLAAGVSEVDTAWLAQVIFAGAQQLGGDEALSNLYAVVLLASNLILLRVFYLQTGRIGWAVGGVLGVLLVIWSRHAIMRPEVFGGLCFSTLLWLMVRMEPWASSAAGIRARSIKPGFSQRSQTVREIGLLLGLAALFAAWANLHGSFAAGLIVLAAVATGNSLQALWQTRSLRGVLSNRTVQRAWLCFDVALVATLLNPYGLDMWVATLHFGSNPNLNEVLEWYPLRLIDLEGLALIVTLGLVMTCLRQSRRKVRPAEVLAFLALAGMTALRVRMISWYGPLVFFLLMPHLASICRSKGWKLRRTKLTAEELTPTHFIPTLACGLVLWVAFSLSPLSKPVLGGESRAESHLYSQGTPLGVTKYLHEHPTQGLVFCPQWWGDWITSRGPAGTQVFMTTHVHLAPRRVWTDYLQVARGQGGWQGVLEKYDVRTLIVHKQLQTNLAAQARGAGDWKTVFEDDLAIVLQRTN